MTVKNRLLLIISSVILVGIIVFLGIVSLTPKTTVKIVLVPDEADMTYGGKTVHVVSETPTEVTPGTYNIQISRNEFGGYVQKVTFVEGKETDLFVYLTPLTANAQAINNSDINQQRSEAIAGHQVSNGGQQVQTTDPIVKILPLQDQDYNVKICDVPANSTKKKDFAICISATSDEAYNKAVKAMTDQGYDPFQYDIVDISQTGL